MQSDVQMKAYYKQRAPVYDRVYGYPERQRNLRFLEDYVAEVFSGKQVIEVAAGTGYWTQYILPTASSVLCTDATSQALMQIDNRRSVTEHSAKLSKQVVDAYALQNIEGAFNAGFAGLWLSHVPVAKRRAFIEGLHQKLEPGALVVFIDNSKAQCEEWPIMETDGQGNSYQHRVLDDGSTHKVLKNFPSEAELVALIQGIGVKPQWLSLEHFWLFSYHVA